MNLEKFPDAYTKDIYVWIDEILKASGFSVGSTTPSTRQMGVNIEEGIYNSLKTRLNSILADVDSTTPQYELVNRIQNEVRLWTQEMAEELDEVTRNLFLRGYAAGIASSAVKETVGLIDLQALQLVQSNPNAIGSRIVTFTDNLVDIIRRIIADSYTSEGVPFSVPAIVNAIKEEVSGKRWMIERIVRTETAVVSNIGRLVGWNNDEYKYYYEYHWNTHFDSRTKEISKLRSSYNPLTFTEACFLWERQEQRLPNGKWQADQFNQRCSLSRKPREREFRGNRFSSMMMDFRITTTLGFAYD